MNASADSQTLAVGPSDVHAAARRIAGHVHRTPLLTSKTLDQLVDGRVFSKAENLQRTGSFKIRGALNRLLSLDPAVRERGVVAFSSGNHAQGVALAARIVGIPAWIVMPTDAPAVKRDATFAYGAHVIGFNRGTEDRRAIAERVADEKGATLVPPFNDPYVIAGQGTVGLEIVEELSNVDVLVVPVGGGGLIAGMSVAVRERHPSIRIIGVEPDCADDARQSLALGSIVHIDEPQTVADGVATTSLGELTFPILSAYVDEIVTVSEAEILSALTFVMTRMKQVVEPTGALSTAALLSGRVRAPGQVIASVFCGGNLDLDLLRRFTPDS